MNAAIVASRFTAKNVEPAVIPCISVRQPWAWLLVNGVKKVENRTWETSYRGPLLIHASRTTVDLIRTNCSELFADMPPADMLPLGCLVGMVHLAECITLKDAQRRRDLAGQGRFIEGPFCWIMNKPRPMFKPISFIGRLGLFRVPVSLLPMSLRRNLS